MFCVGSEVLLHSNSNILVVMHSKELKHILGDIISSASDPLLLV